MGNYICCCGKQFETQKSLCAHKASCEAYYLKRDGDLKNYLKHKKNVQVSNKDVSKIEKRKKKQREYFKKKEESELEKWVDEKHTCSLCGCVMTARYGSGNFCSERCARSSSSRNVNEDRKAKIRETIKEVGFTRVKFKDKYIKVKIKDISKINLLKIIHYYYIEPRYCKVCGRIIPYMLRKRKTCSDGCYSKLVSEQVTGKVGGYIQFSGNNKENKGYYKGVYCDSTWELAYVIYNIDHNIPIKRCEKVYEYTYNNKARKYHPDFELEDGTIVEIKGYEYDESLQYKIASVKDVDVKVLRRDDLQYIFDYVVETYGKDFRKMYDNT